jgi:exonuclease SbcD
MRPARLLHTSDCHLGTSDQRREEEAFSRAVDLAIVEDVDAVLLVGDLFDSARVPESILEWTAGQLDRLRRPVVLIPGNHDVLDATTIYQRFEPSERCVDVTFIDAHLGATVEVAGTDVVVWGRAMVEHEPGFRPLQGIPGRVPGRWCVVAAHGLVMSTDEPTYRGSPIYPADLDAVDWDYVALGHIHAHAVLGGRRAPACYPGATAASHDGQPGAVMVDLVPGAGASVRWVGLRR